MTVRIPRLEFATDAAKKAAAKVLRPLVTRNLMERRLGFEFVDVAQDHVLFRCTTKKAHKELQHYRQLQEVIGIMSERVQDGKPVDGKALKAALEEVRPTPKAARRKPASARGRAVAR